MARQTADLRHHLYQSLHILKNGALELSSTATHTPNGANLTTNIGLMQTAYVQKIVKDENRDILIITTKLLTIFSSSSITTAMPW